MVLDNLKIDRELKTQMEKDILDTNFPLRTDKAYVSVAILLLSNRWKEINHSEGSKGLDDFRKEISKISKELFSRGLVSKNSSGF